MHLSNSSPVPYLLSGVSDLLKAVVYTELELSILRTGIIIQSQQIQQFNYFKSYFFSLQMA